MGTARSIDSYQSSQSVQADHNRNFSLLADFLCIKVPIAPNWKGVCLQNTRKSNSYHLKIWQLL